MLKYMILPTLKLKIIYVQEFFLFVYFIMPKVLKNRKRSYKKIKRKSLGKKNISRTRSKSRSLRKKKKSRSKPRKSSGKKSKLRTNKRKRGGTGGPRPPPPPPTKKPPPQRPPPPTKPYLPKVQLPGSHTENFPPLPQRPSPPPPPESGTQPVYAEPYSHIKSENPEQPVYATPETNEDDEGDGFGFNPDELPAPLLPPPEEFSSVKPKPETGIEPLTIVPRPPQDDETGALLKVKQEPKEMRRERENEIKLGLEAERTRKAQERTRKAQERTRKANQGIEEIERNQEQEQQRIEAERHAAAQQPRTLEDLTRKPVVKQNNSGGPVYNFYTEKHFPNTPKDLLKRIILSEITITGNDKDLDGNPIKLPTTPNADYIEVEMPVVEVKVNKTTGIQSPVRINKNYVNINYHSINRNIETGSIPITAIQPYVNRIIEILKFQIQQKKEQERLNTIGNT
jgi:hypothetical protein